MSPTPQPGTERRISPAAVRRATRRDWDEWFALLDAAGANAMEHRDIVAVAREAGAGRWWQQMIAVTYEQERGLRERNEKPDGFEVSITRTVAAPADRVFALWHEARSRARWMFGHELRPTTATAPTSLRGSWDGGPTRVDVAFSPAGEGRTRVTVQHSRLPDAGAVTATKLYWAEALDRLTALLAH